MTLKTFFASVAAMLILAGAIRTVQKPGNDVSAIERCANSDGPLHTLHCVVKAGRSKRASL